MEYISGIIAGVLIGGLAGWIKYFFLWRPVLKAKDNRTDGKVLHRLGIGYFINIATLLAVFFLRNVLPFSFEATAIAAAVALSITARIWPITKVLRESGNGKNRE